MRIQKATSRRAARELDRVLRRFEPRIARAFAEAAKRVRDRVSARAIAAALEAGDVARAVELVGADALADSLRGAGLEPGVKSVQEELTDAFREGGVAAARQLPRSAALAASLDLTNPEAVRFLREHMPVLIREISNEAREAARDAVLRGFAEGRPLPSIAREVRESVGLTRAQSGYVQNLRRQLEAGAELGMTPPGDRRLSAPERQRARSIMAAGGERSARVDALVERYRESLVNRRAKNIARTEAHRAHIEGQDELWRQARGQGLIQAEATRRVWIVTPDDRLRQCVPPKTPVLTLKGWRAISSLREGDFVMTNEDRFKPVLKTFSKRYDGDWVEIQFGGRSRIKVTATADHPVMTRAGWIPIGDICLDTEVKVLAVPCPGCHELIPRGPGRRAWCKSCGHEKCIKAAAAPEVRAQAVASRQKGGGWRKGYVGTPHSKESKRKIKKHAQERVRQGTMRDFSDPVIQRKAQMTSSLKNPLENRVAEFLSGQGIDFERQYKFEGAHQNFWADFYLPGPQIVIECDGWFHTRPEVIKKDKARDKELLKRGVETIRFTKQQIEEDFAAVGSVIRERCCFIWLKPRRITWSRVSRQSVHDIQVEDDVSFIAGGVVVHNSHAAIPSMNPKGVGLEETFNTPFGPVTGPGDVHPELINCRCTVALEFTDG